MAKEKNGGGRTFLNLCLFLKRRWQDSRSVFLSFKKNRRWAIHGERERGKKERRGDRLWRGKGAMSANGRTNEREREKERKKLRRRCLTRTGRFTTGENEKEELFAKKRKQKRTQTLLNGCVNYLAKRAQQQQKSDKFSHWGEDTTLFFFKGEKERQHSFTRQKHLHTHKRERETRRWWETNVRALGTSRASQNKKKEYGRINSAKELHWNTSAFLLSFLLASR